MTIILSGCLTVRSRIRRDESLIMLYLQRESTPHEKDPPLISFKHWPRPRFPSTCTTCPTTTLSELGNDAPQPRERRRREREIERAKRCRCKRNKNSEDVKDRRQKEQRHIYIYQRSVQYSQNEVTSVTPRVCPLGHISRYFP